MRGVLIFLIGFGVLCMLALVGWVAARLTGALQWYVVPSVANYPTLHRGDHFFTSNLVQPQRLDFIAYRHDEPGQKPVDYFHRLVALPGDTLEMRRGLLVVNGQNLDADLHLMHNYTLPRAAFTHLPADVVAVMDTAALDRTRPDSISSLGLPDADVARLHLPARRLVRAPDYYDAYVQEQYHHSWNQDSFGPVVVPANCYFVLGDNRHNSLDSRYTGFIARSRFRGTMLGRR